MHIGFDIGSTTAYGAIGGVVVVSVVYFVAKLSKSIFSFGGLGSVGVTVAPYHRWVIAGAVGGATIGFIIEKIF